MTTDVKKKTKQKNNKQTKKNSVSFVVVIFLSLIFQDYYILFSLKIKEHCSKGKSTDGKVMEMRRRGSDRENKSEGDKCEDGEGVKSSEEKEQGRKEERVTDTEREMIKKEHAQGTMAQKSTQTKTAVKTVKQGQS